MAHLINNTAATADARGSLGHQEHPWAGSGAEVGIPNTEFSYVFHVKQPVLIWYFRDESWHEGVIVRFRGSESDRSCEVQFCAGGPRIRIWCETSRGFIRPDTLTERETLRAQGCFVKSPRL